MPLSTDIIGEQTQTVEHQVDARWLMAYAASLGDLNTHYMDTTKAIAGHPVFPVCLEWPSILETRQLAGSDSLTDTESAMGVHAAHDLHIYRPISADETLHTKATVVDVQSIRPGAASVMRLDTWDEQDELVCQTYQTSIYRGVEVTRSGNSLAIMTPTLPAHATAFELAKTVTITVDGGLAHSYSECAHIWNPIHTDKAVALAAGLPDIILHGTATLALAWVLDQAEHLIPIPGTRSATHAAQFIKASGFKMTSEIRNNIDGVLPVGWAYGDRYSENQWIGVERYA